MQLALSQPCSYLDLGGSESSQTTHSFSSLCLHLPPAQTMSLLVTAAQSHSPEPSMTQKGLSEKTLLLFCSRMGRRGDRQREQRRALSPRVCVHVCVCASASRNPVPLLFPPPGPPSSPSKRSTAK